MKSKKGFKIFICVCVGIICVGTVFAGIGFLMGGTPNVNYESGVGFVPVQSESAFYKGKTEIVNEDLESFTGIEIYAGASDVSFIESDKYAIEYCYKIKTGKPNVSVVDGTLTYGDSWYDQHKGINLNLLNDGKNTKAPMYVTIYYPAGTHFNSIFVDSEMGDFTIKGIDAASLEANVALGEVDLDSITASKLEIEANVGDIDIKHAVTDELDISTDVGDIDIEGELRGHNSISCNVGDIYIKTSLSALEYNFDLNDVAMGDAIINGMNVKRSYTQSNAAANDFELENNVGEVEVQCK